MLFNHDQIREAVIKVLSERLPQIHVLSVNIREGADDDDDDVIVNVVFDTDDKKFDPAKLQSIPNEIVVELSAKSARGFPILSFIAKSDLGKKKPEAA
jgi:hypothetical protein